MTVSDGRDGSPATSLFLSTGSLPELDRLPIWREVFGQTLARLDIEPITDAPFHAEGALCALPGAAHACVNASPVRVARTRQLIAGDSIEMLYLMTAETSLRVVQGGQEKILTAGDAIFVRGGDTSCIVAQDTTRFINVAVPLSTLTPQRPQCDDLAMTVVPKDNEVLNLLLGYVELLRAQHGKMSAPLAQLAAAHIRDLFATIGDDHPLTAPLPRESAGLRAARLTAIKADIRTKLCEPDLSADRIAAQQGISPRYMRKLFQEEHTTFSDHVLALRLGRARDLLRDPRYATRTISWVAYSCGFGDLSYFNRTFRRRYGATPSDARSAAFR